MRCYFFQYYKCAFFLLPFWAHGLFHTLPLRYPSTLGRWILFYKDARKETHVIFIHFLILENRIFQKEKRLANQAIFLRKDVLNFLLSHFKGQNQYTTLTVFKIFAHKSKYIFENICILLIYFKLISKNVHHKFNHRRYVVLHICHQNFDSEYLVNLLYGYIFCIT